MDPQKKSLRIGVAAIAAAVLLRFFSVAGPELLRDMTGDPRFLALLHRMEAGQQHRDPDGGPQPTVIASFPEPDLDYSPESPPPVPPPLPRFSDPVLTELTYLCPLRPDIGRLLQQPLDWRLADGTPTVLIFHTHTTESYERGTQDYEESAPYRTPDPGYNMLAIGDAVAAHLNRQGIVTLHDREFYDYPDYNGCYGRTRRAVSRYLKEYPSLRLVLDLHRDASDGRGGQLRTLARVRDRDSAQLMLVVGTNASGAGHRHWQENLSLALKLQAQLQTQCPGIARPLSLRAQRFNQDLSPGALLIEVGAAGNTLQEALLAAGQLAEAITALSRGTGPVTPAPSALSGPPG